MHKFDYSFLDNGLLPTGILNLTSTISALKALANERRDKNLQVYLLIEWGSGLHLPESDIRHRCHH